MTLSRNVTKLDRTKHSLELYIAQKHSGADHSVIPHGCTFTRCKFCMRSLSQTSRKKSLQTSAPPESWSTVRELHQNFNKHMTMTCGSMSHVDAHTHGHSHLMHLQADYIILTWGSLCFLHMLDFVLVVRHAYECQDNTSWIVLTLVSLFSRRESVCI